MREFLSWDVRIMGLTYTAQTIWWVWTSIVVPWLGETGYAIKMIVCQEVTGGIHFVILACDWLFAKMPHRASTLERYVSSKLVNDVIN